MRTFRVLCLFLLLGGGLALASGHVHTVAQFQRDIRMEMRISTGALLPDSVLLAASQRAILWTSTDIGGYEKRYKIQTHYGQAFYALPDTIVEVISASLISGMATKNLRGTNTEYFEAPDVAAPDFAGEDSTGADRDKVPYGYHYWADTIQLMPIPAQLDSFYLSCYVEHPMIDSTVDSIKLKPPFIEAARDFAMHLAYRSIQDYDAATFYLTLYKERRAELRGKYLRKYLYRPEAEK